MASGGLAETWEDIEADDDAVVSSYTLSNRSMGESAQLLMALQQAASLENVPQREPMVILNITALTQGAVGERPREGSQEEALMADVLAVLLHEEDFEEEADALFEAEMIFHAEREEVRVELRGDLSREAYGYGEEGALCV